MSQNIHDGHRERLKSRFVNHGLDSFESHQVLELLLFYALPRKDTNPLAHELLNTFGSLPAVLEASVKDLCKVKGISEHSATLIRLCGELLKRYEQEIQSGIKAFTRLDEIGAYLQPHFRGETREKVVLVCLNNRSELLGVSTLGTGGLVSTEAKLREIIEQVVILQATRVVLEHNHPAGFAIPSAADLSPTRRIIESLKIMEVEVVDHIIFSKDDYISMRQTPQYAPLFSGLVGRLDAR